MGMQRTLKLQQGARLIRVSKVMALQVLKHHQRSMQNAVLMHIFSPDIASARTIISACSNLSSRESREQHCSIPAQCCFLPRSI